MIKIFANIPDQVVDIILWVLFGKYLSVSAYFIDLVYIMPNEGNNRRIPNSNWLMHRYGREITPEFAKAGQIV